MNLKKTMLVMAVGWISWAAYAQFNPNGIGYGSPATAIHMQQQQQMQNQNQGYAANAAAQAEANRQWWAEENRIRAKIEKLKQTPFYGALAMDVGTGHIGWGGGFHTKQLAIDAAKENCKTDNCPVIAVFSNTCAMAAMPDRDKGNLESTFVAYDDVGQRAIEKAYFACEAKYGSGNCSFAGNGPKKEAFCSGYKYGFYKQK